jgi:hypothetical protein
MYAIKARNIALKANESKYVTQYATIRSLIEKWARAGYFDYTYHEKILLEVKKELEKEGYKVEEAHDPGQEYCVCISW